MTVPHRLDGPPTPREQRLFLAATILIGIHTVADTFVFPQPATHWSSHLAPALAPLVLLAAANLVYPRIPPGARAAVAAVLGLLAVEGAALALADALRTFARASDWTGFLLAPAGLALLAVAAVLLWRSRRPRGHSVLRRAAILAGVVVGAYWVVVPVSMALYATHRPRAAVSTVLLGAPYRSVQVRTRDGLDLAGWYAPSRNGAAVISFPTRIGKLPQARLLIRHGYGVLLLDMRGYDGSDGSPNAFGWGSTKDIDAAVAWLRRRPDVRAGKIGGIGFSVGGEQMIEAAADNPALEAVVSEGAGERSVRESLIRGPRGWLAVPAMAAETTAVAILSQTLPPPSLQKAVAQVAPRAVLLIYAGRGGGGEELNVDFFRAARQPKALWRIEGARHVGGLDARPAEYERRVVSFFDRTLKPPR
jgi:dienelactone hydrolase